MTYNSGEYHIVTILSWDILSEIRCKLLALKGVLHLICLGRHLNTFFKCELISSNGCAESEVIRNGKPVLPVQQNIVAAMTFKVLELF